MEGHLSDEEGSNPSKGTCSSGDDQVFSWVEDMLSRGGGGLLVVGVSILRNIENWVCDRCGVKCMVLTIHHHQSCAE